MVFASDADDLSDQDGAGRDTFAADVAEGTLGLIAGTPAAVSSGRPQISDDGRSVAFLSDDPRLTEDGERGLFLLRLETGLVDQIPAVDDSLVTLNVADISADGRFVTYFDPAAGGENRLFRWDSATGAVVRIDDAAPGAGSGSMSSDGNLVAFSGEGAVRNVATGEVVVSSDQINFFEGFVAPVGHLSGDGRNLFFNSASDLFSGHVDLWALDIASGAIEEVSTTAAGVSGDADSSFLGASANGRFVAMLSRAGNLVAGNDDGGLDLLVKDLLTGEIVRVAEDVLAGTISADGAAVAYLAQGENGQNQVVWAPTGLAGGTLGGQAAGSNLSGPALDQLLVAPAEVA